MDQTTPDPLTTDRARRRRITVTVDVELFEAIDRKRGGLARSPCVEQVLEAAMPREHPHLPTDWTPEAHAERRYARLAARARAAQGLT